MINNFIIITAQNHGNANEYNIKLPFRIYNASVSISDCDTSVDSQGIDSKQFAYSNIRIGWIDKTLRYAGVNGGHTICIIGTI